MSAPESRQVKHLVDGLPFWPPSTIGWTPHEYFPVTAAPPAPRTMQPADFRHFTPAGLEQLARILRAGIAKAKAGAR